MKKNMDAAVFLLFTYPFGILVGMSFWLFRFLGIARVSGWENFPRWQEKILVISNHPSLLEPIILTGLFFHQFLWRPFKYGPWNMAEKGNYGKRLFFFLRPRMILIERGSERSAARGFIRAKDVLNSGGVMIIFPEGCRTHKAKAILLGKKRQSRVGKFKGGFARLAAKTGATVLPVWVGGTERVLPNGAKVSYWYFLRFWRRVTIRLGEPLYFRGEDYEEMTRRSEAAVLALADQRED